MKPLVLGRRVHEHPGLAMIGTRSRFCYPARPHHPVVPGQATGGDEEASTGRGHGQASALKFSTEVALALVFADWVGH